MPWTFAHPAAILPLRRLCPRLLSFAGLAIGSLMPDAGYYVGRYDIAFLAHQPRGIVLICLPLGLLLLVLLRHLHAPVAALLPQPHRSALLALAQTPSLLSLRAVLVAAVSIVLGAFTHSVWDAFTHETGFAVQALPLLQQPLFQAQDRLVRVCNVLQHISTVVGLAFLTAHYLRFLRHALRRAPHAAAVSTGTEWRRYGLLAMLAAVALAAALPLAHAYASAHAGGVGLNLSLFVVRSVVYATSVFAVLLVLAALLIGRKIPR
jgi:hypothetical protein